ncbi:MAG: hypothetical protein IPP48_12600 [Chitinophagaceae bacterium]|nr:hypothetical protein [Chitinophagaceae bacterium]
MKSLSIFAAIVISIFTTTLSFAQTTTTTEIIKVWGNCGMCKTTIEKAAKKAGAKTAKWNEDTKELKVTYATVKSSGTKIQQAIANAGYDTQDFTADNNAYNNLHKCCQYDRKDAGAASNAPDKTNAKVTYSCPMHADVKSDKAGSKCTKCGMDLIKDNK